MDRSMPGRLIRRIVGKLSGKRLARTQTTDARLIAAIEADNIQAVWKAIGDGADPRHSDDRGYADLPLRKACYFGHSAIVKFLINQGADANAQNFEGLSAPLRLAAKSGHMRVVASLLKRGSLYTPSILHMLPDGIAKQVADVAAALRDTVAREKSKKVKKLPEATARPVSKAAIPARAPLKAEIPLSRPPLCSFSRDQEQRDNASDNEEYFLDEGCYGLDTNVLCMDIERIEREFEEAERERIDSLTRRKPDRVAGPAQNSSPAAPSFTGARAEEPVP